MSDKNREEKKNYDNTQTASSTGEITDPPPPYTPYKSNDLRPEPPAPPNNPPALTHETISDERPTITPEPDPRTTEYTNHSVWGVLKAICCVVLCCPWIACVSCIGTCFHMCPDPKPRQDQ